MWSCFVRWICMKPIWILLLPGQKMAVNKESIYLNRTTSKQNFRVNSIEGNAWWMMIWDDATLFDFVAVAECLIPLNHFHEQRKSVQYFIIAEDFLSISYRVATQRPKRMYVDDIVMQYEEQRMTLILLAAIPVTLCSMKSFHSFNEIRCQLRVNFMEIPR